MHKLLSISCCLFFISLAISQNCNDVEHVGEGTFYGGVAGGIFGNCSLPVEANDVLHCAMNNFDYDNSNACGAFIEVTGANGSIILKVVDRCPECQPGDVDMTMEAFAQIANIEDGRVPISWKYVPSEIEETIKVNFKEGSSIFWTAIQLRGLKHAVKTLEYELPDLSWKIIDRKIYNYFVEDIGIPSPMNLRATPIIGEPLLFSNIEINLNEDYNTNQQFVTPPECVTTLSVVTFNKEKISVYPNPTSGLLYLKGTSKLWKLIDITGKLLQTGSSKKLDLSHFTNGIYFLKVNTKTLKIVKNN